MNNVYVCVGLCNVLTAFKLPVENSILRGFQRCVSNFKMGLKTCGENGIQSDELQLFACGECRL